MKAKISLIIVTVTCNTSGGQPVSMQNMKEVKAMADKYGIPVCFDSARFAENVYFIKKRDANYKHTSIKEIVKEMYTYADLATMSAKKTCDCKYGSISGNE